MANAWFETVAEAQRRARRRLPRSVYKALLAGSERGTSMADNVRAMEELEFAPRIGSVCAARDLSTTVLAQQVDLPVLISPTGVQAVHPDGELAMARASASRGTMMGLSSFASKPIEQVVEANPKTLFQVYWSGTRDAMVERVQRAKDAGSVGLIVTLDWSFSMGRDWGSPWIPERVDLKALLKLAPEGVTSIPWLVSFLKAKDFPDLTAPNMAVGGGAAPTFFGAYGEWMQTPPPTWEDIAWLRETWGGPFMVKGIYRVEDAERAVAAGATAISVSNHGGNNLDGTPSPMRVLASVVDRVGEDVEVCLDGGVRRGSDVVKALALGARAVMIGRASLWGLGANGQDGVENVLDVLRGGIDSALIGLGRASVRDLCRDDVIVPAGFTRLDD